MGRRESDRSLLQTFVRDSIFFHTIFDCVLRFLQMLIGLRETDDRIVAATFSALAVMVPILGSNIVVGGERRKYFIEGRPKVYSCLYNYLASVVQRVDNAIHRINHYPVDSVVCFANTYPLDSDLSGG